MSLFKKKKFVKENPDIQYGIKLFQCQNPDCDCVHFDDVGYMKIMGQKYKEIMLCVNCGACYIHVDRKMIDVTDRVSLKQYYKV